MDIRTIVVPTDFSDHAVSAGAYAMWLADNHQASVVFLHVVQPETGDLDVPVISAKRTKDRIEAAREVLKAFGGAVDTKIRSMYQPRKSIETSAEVIVGAPGSEIPKVLARQADLCVIGTRGEHNRLDHLFGSVTTTVLKRSDVPVFVVPSDIDHLSISNAGYATELELTDGMLLWRMARLLKPFHPQIAIVHVNDSERSEHETSLEELKTFSESAISLSTSTFELKGDDIGDLLNAFSKRHKLDLLALRAQRRSWFESLWHPSIRRKLALEAEVPLLLLR